MARAEGVGQRVDRKSDPALARCGRPGWRSVLLAAAAVLAAPAAVSAALVQVYYVTGTSNVDQNYEFQGGWLQSHYHLPNIPGSAPGSTVLPQTERAVGQIASNNANGLHLPTSASGIPGAGNGVVSALTNHSPMGNGSNGGGTVSGALSNFSTSSTTFSLAFSFSRTGQTTSYTVGGKTWTSAANAYYDDIETIEVRVRSTANNSLTLGNLVFNDAVTVNQQLPSISAASSNVTISVLEGAQGDYSLTGTYNYTGSGSWNHQLKGLDLLSVPEPTSVALAIAVSGCGLLFRPTRKRKPRRRGVAHDRALRY